MPPFPCRMLRRQAPSISVPLSKEAHQGQWSRSSRSQGVVLGGGGSADQEVRGTKGQPSFLPPLEVLINQKPLLGCSGSSLFSQVMLHLFTQGRFSYAGLLYPRSMKVHQSYQKENLKGSSLQEFSDSERWTLNLPTQ